MDPEDDYGYGNSAPPASIRSRSNSRPPHRARGQRPQDAVKQFWDQFNTKYPGKVYTVLPDNPYARTRARQVPNGVIQGQEAVKSYEQAKRECKKSVERIVKECERVNQKYTDPHFDLELDLKSGRRDYLDALDKMNEEMRPRGVKRVTIFEKPQFFVNGPTASDVRQGYDGDCWLMAALCTLGNRKDLIENICVARNEKIGIYGFVFYRGRLSGFHHLCAALIQMIDGEWQQCIVDDKLYLRAADYDESVEERPLWDDINRKDTEEEYRRVWQTGSRALYFAQCVDPNETWLPLLEKAFAKAHGDYSAIEGGFVGEGIEDLTGGVTSEVLSNNILDTDRFWTEELMKVNKEFLFGCGTGLFSNWLDPKYRGPPRDRKGISENHSYSIMEAREIRGHRLLRLRYVYLSMVGNSRANVDSSRNPWGRKEWHGAWGDGSEQWTAEWMELLGHKFGNDGLDTRYFKGLGGEYSFVLKFRLQKEGEEDYMVRSHNSHFMGRSVNAEIDLDPGRYHVLMKITAFRHEDQESTEEIVRRLASSRREKLVQVGLSYDLAHAKGLVADTEQERWAQERRKAAERKRLRDETKERLQKEWIRERKMAARQQRQEARHARQRSRGLSYERSPDRGPLPPQILNDAATQSPTDVASISSDGSDRRPTPSGSVPTIQFNGLHARHASGSRKRRTDSPRPSLTTRFATGNLDTTDLELLEGFEFDSDLDMPPDDNDLKQPPPSFPLVDEPAADPWNAVCVVGLRVYSHDPKLSLEVVRPIADDDPEAALDRDDPAASATLEKMFWGTHIGM
ncbi:Alpha/beta hydrolase fold-3 [Penicillium capsulatum]|uniref:Alpha/beta hydrolase fold-3 n=1 Tax=Penicillium capsulatum TaxID=69766 RepID=A0A9W9LS85_9EURO|nr:Alpha/beta hydrolase fold-3 [Penicillium capsulatum]